jgi:hypothetical protein
VKEIHSGFGIPLLAGKLLADVIERVGRNLFAERQIIVPADHAATEIGHQPGTAQLIRT